MESIGKLLSDISNVVWGPVTIVLLVGTGLYLTLRLRFVQFFYLRHAVQCIRGKYDRADDAGDVSHFRALAAALSATIGTGNIAGVATALHAGGPGAIFWMWVTALVGMATKFASCMLAVQFRVVHKDGSVSGGPMYYLEKGFAPSWLIEVTGHGRTQRIGVILAVLFAAFGMVASFGIGNMVQANSVVDGIHYLVPASWQAHGLGGVTEGKAAFSWVAIATGFVLAGLVALVILGGIKRIAAVAARIVPVMCVIYVAGALLILFLYAKHVPEAFGMIFKYAFQPYEPIANAKAMTGGALGFVVSQTIRFGVARGVFSNESGLGSAPIAHAAAKTDEPVREGMVAMLGPFIDTIIVCTMTAMVILVTQINLAGEENGAELTALAFYTGLKFEDQSYGHLIVGVGLALFAFSTVISWSYYGDRCTEYLFGPKAIKPYRIVFVALIIVGALGGLKTIWTIADILNGLMAIPNLIGLIALSGIVATQTRQYRARLRAGALEHGRR